MSEENSLETGVFNTTHTTMDDVKNELAGNHTHELMAHSKTQLDGVIDQMFQNESDRIINDEEQDSGYGKVIITIIAIMMSAIILLSFLYKFI